MVLIKPSGDYSIQTESLTNIMSDTAWKNMQYDFMGDRVTISSWDGNDYEIFTSINYNY